MFLSPTMGTYQSIKIKKKRIKQVMTKRPMKIRFCGLTSKRTSLLTLPLSPQRLCQNSRNERKSVEENGRADEKALERNLHAFGLKGSNSMKRLRFEHQGHLPINLIMLRVLRL
jgi:hypothetical protein